MDKELSRFYRLSEGLQLSEEQLLRILDLSYEKLAKDYALDFLGGHARSESEVRDRLRQKKIRGSYIDKAVSDLKRTGLIDDASYAVRLSRDLLDRKPMGAYLLRQELKKRGIPDEISDKTINEVYQENDLLEAALRAIRKKPRYLRIADEQERKRKIYDFLMHRGFGYDEIGSALAAIDKEIEETNKRKPE